MDGIHKNVFDAFEKDKFWWFKNISDWVERREAEILFLSVYYEESLTACSLLNIAFWGAVIFTIS